MRICVFLPIVSSNFTPPIFPNVTPAVSNQPITTIDPTPIFYVNKISTDPGNNLIGNVNCTITGQPITQISNSYYNI
jgi:hypothetical protein